VDIAEEEALLLLLLLVVGGEVEAPSPCHESELTKLCVTEKDMKTWRRSMRIRIRLGLGNEMRRLQDQIHSHDMEPPLRVPLLHMLLGDMEEVHFPQWHGGGGASYSSVPSTSMDTVLWLRTICM